MKHLNIFFLFIISGCGNPHPVVLPETNELSNAIVNQKYQQTIEIQGGPVNESSVSVSIVPADSGLVWMPEKTKYSIAKEEISNENYHHIIIFGTPQKTGDYNIIVSGFTLGTMYSGSDFYRKYTIKIEQ